MVSSFLKYGSGPKSGPDLWKPHIQHDCKLDDFWTGFEIAERYKIGHGIDANIQHAVGQGGLF